MKTQSTLFQRNNANMQNNVFAQITKMATDLQVNGLVRVTVNTPLVQVRLVLKS